MTTPREVMTAQTLAFVEPALPEPCSRVLEIGCGEGDLARRLMEGGRTVLEAELRAVSLGAVSLGAVKPLGRRFVAES